MKSNEYTSKVTIQKTIDEGDGWPTYKMQIESVDNKATILLNKKRSSCNRQRDCRLLGRYRPQ